MGWGGGWLCVFVCVPWSRLVSSSGFLPGCRGGCWWNGFNSTNLRRPHSPLYGATFITHFNSLTLTWPRCILRMQHSHIGTEVHTVPTRSHISVPHQCLLFDPNFTLHLTFCFTFNYVLVSQQEAPRSRRVSDAFMREVQYSKLKASKT